MHPSHILPISRHPSSGHTFAGRFRDIPAASTVVIPEGSEDTRSRGLAVGTRGVVFPVGLRLSLIRVSPLTFLAVTNYKIFRKNRLKCSKVSLYKLLKSRLAMVTDFSTSVVP